MTTSNEEAVSNGTEPNHKKPNIFFPLLLGIMGCLFTSMSFIMMKISHNRFSQGLLNGRFLNRYWLLGFFFILCGCLFNTLSLSVGNQTLLAGTSPCTVILTCFLSVIILKERLLKIDFLAIMIICVGSVFFLSNTKNVPREFSQEEVY